MPGVEIFRRPLDFSDGSRSHLRPLARLSGRGHAHDEPELPDTGRPAALCRARPERLPCPRSPVPPRGDAGQRGIRATLWFSARSPLFTCRGPRPRRRMRHHRHARRCHQHTAARRCRAHRSSGPDCRERAPGRRRSGTGQRRGGTSRIAPAPIREPRGHEAAGQVGSPAVSKEPDCRGRLAVKLLRLLGGRR